MLPTGAETRFKNDQTKAKAAAKVNPSAKSAFRLKTQKVNAPQKGGMQVPQAPRQAPIRVAPQVSQPQEVPQAVPDVGFLNPEPPTFQDEVADILERKKIQEFITSPEVDNAYSLSHLQDHFKRMSPVPDTRDTAQKVLSNLM